jgi:predicted nucleic acid-binding protein
LVTELDLVGNDLNDAWLAALAIEHDATLVSLDRGFERFPSLRWREPGGNE